MPEQTTMTTYTAWDDVETYMRACVDVARFLPCCAKCPNYETKWSCPPYDFDVQALWHSYTRIHLIFQKIEMPDFDIAFSSFAWDNVIGSAFIKRRSEPYI